MKQRDAFLATLGLRLVWQILAMFVNLPILPAPVKVFTVFIDELGNGLLSHFVYSLWRVFAGMMLEAALAILVLRLQPCYALLVIRLYLGYLFSPSLYDVEAVCRLRRYEEE